MIRFTDIYKRFDEKAVLSGVSLELDKGITCLMGASGAGKTTLLRILTGLETPDSGRIQNVPSRMAVMFQEDRLTQSLTVRGNLRLALGRQYDKEKTQRLLNALLLPNVMDEQVSTLSGGMKRRVALCRALLFDADLLVLDEPFKGLDEETKRTVMDVIKAHCADRTALIVTHDEDEAAYLGARVVRL